MSQVLATALPWQDQAETQDLALRGYGYQLAKHYLLRVTDLSNARRFLRELVQSGAVRYGPRSANPQLDAEPWRSCAVNIGFDYQGLLALELRREYLAELQNKAVAFTAGARARAAEHLGDTGASAVDRWDAAYGADAAHVVVSLHASTQAELSAAFNELHRLSGARTGFSGWDTPQAAAHLVDSANPTHLFVHFGYRDGISRPVIVLEDKQPPSTDQHAAGELLLGHLNDAQFDRWSGKDVDPAKTRFFRNGSFAALRKIRQHEKAFHDFLDAAVEQLDAQGATVKPEFVQAKLCGRWVDGAPFLPNPPSSQGGTGDPDFTTDDKGYGCPFGAHIRRTNPRSDPVVQTRRRVLFRRGMPYGPRYKVAPAEDRGLVGLFFCASLEDQFEHMIRHWIERNPLGPDNRGTAKDPLAGNQDDRKAVFEIPRDNAPALRLTNIPRLVTTLGTLYLFYPSRSALSEIAHAAGPFASATTAAGAVNKSTNAGPSAFGSGPFASQNLPRDRFCDVVMEGGITSGIIYPSAIVELAKAYRFRSIGGSSVGAFAAAVTAAAEYRRRHGSDEGFELFAKLPESLAREVDGETELLRLFQPSVQTKRLFKIFIATLNRDSSASRIRHAISAAFAAYRAVALGTAVLTLLLLGAMPGWWIALQDCCDFKSNLPRALSQLTLFFVSIATAGLLGMLFGGVALAFMVFRDVVYGLIKNGYGLCTGGNVGGQDPERTKAVTHRSAARAGPNGRRPQIRRRAADLRGLVDGPGLPAGVAQAVTERDRFE